MLEEVIQMHRAGRLAEAEQGYRQLLEETPDNVEALQLLGILRGQRGDLPEGLHLVQRASELDPESAACRYTLGEMHLRAGALDEAAAAFDQARERNPNLSAAHAGLGQVCLLKGDLDGAESHFKVALRADENDTQAITGLGNVAQARGDAARALQLLSQAVEQAPDDALIQASYAQAMLDQDMIDFAARALDNALAAKPDYPLALALRADLHVRKGELAAALPIYESLLARGQSEGMARAGLGDIARAEGRHDDAIAHYEAALRVQPNLHRAAVRRADALARSGRTREAIDDLREYLAGQPDSLKAHIALAQLLTQTARYDEALAVWQAAEAKWPDDVNLKAQHALTLDRAGHTREAMQQAERAASSPRPAIAMLRARAALLAGDPAAAVQRLQRIEDGHLEGKPPQLARRRQRLLGLAFDALEQWPEAIQAFLAAQPRTGLPALPPLDADEAARLQQRASEPELDSPHGPAPVLLCGLPGSGVGEVAALLSDQPGWCVRSERLHATPDFIRVPVEPRLTGALDPGEIALLARRYRRALERARVPQGDTVADWIPALDARLAPALRRALPGVRMLLVGRNPNDTLLNWMGFGSAHHFAMPDPVSGARWLRLAQFHLQLAAGILPTLRVDPDALLAGRDDAARAALAAFLGVEAITPGPRTRAVQVDRGGLPIRFPTGHAAHYHEVLSEAFAVLDDEVFGGTP